MSRGLVTGRVDIGVVGAVMGVGVGAQNELEQSGGLDLLQQTPPTHQACEIWQVVPGRGLPGVMGPAHLLAACLGRQEPWAPVAGPSSPVWGAAVLMEARSLT